MASNSRIQLMISSRCETAITFKGKTQKLSAVRRALKEEIENFKLPGASRPLFECWINEDATSAPGGETWWKHCVDQAKGAHVVIVLYTGASGGGLEGSSMGICHGELEAALRAGADRVRVIKLPEATLPSEPLQRKRDVTFRKYFESREMFYSSASDGEEVIAKAWLEINSALGDLTRLGASSMVLTETSTGQALDWKRLDYKRRQEAMEKALLDFFLSRPQSAKSTTGAIITIAGGRAFLRYQAIPDSLSLSAAREKVGQPFLTDFQIADEVKKVGAGPIHVVASPKGVTESQALKMLGFPDATIAKDSFGIHVADNIQKIQIVLLKECFSPTAVVRQIAAWLDWLKRTKEDEFVLERARARCRIIQAIARETGNHDGGGAIER